MKFILSTLTLISLISPSAFAGKSASICDRNPDAPMCAQARAPIPKSLPQSYSVGYLVAHAQAAFTTATGEQAGQASCAYANTRKVAFSCQFVSSSGRLCKVDLLQIWSNADYTLNCQGGLSLRTMVNPGQVPATMD